MGIHFDLEGTFYQVEMRENMRSCPFLLKKFLLTVKLNLDLLTLLLTVIFKSCKFKLQFLSRSRRKCSSKERFIVLQCPTIS